MALAIGDKAPDFKLASDSGEIVSLSDFKGKKVILYFYPQDDTPGCTKQACSLRDAYSKLSDTGVRVYGVSTDDEKAQKAFQEKFRLPFQLLADKEKKVVEAFDVPTTMGYAKRQAFLFRDGVLVWRDLEASTEEQAADVMKAIAESKG